MNKFLIIAVCLLFVLTGCNKSPDQKLRSDAGSYESEMQVGLEINQAMKEALETDDFKTFNGKLDALMEKHSSNASIKASVYGAKFMALLFDEDLDGLKKMIEEMDDPEFREEYEKYMGDEHPGGTIKLTKAQFCYSFGLEERGDAIVNDIVQNEEIKAVKQMALIMSGRKYYVKKDVENFKKTIEAAIAIDPTNMIGRAFSQEMDIVIQKMMSEDGTEGADEAFEVSE